ncbi:MAG: ABC-type metal ion transporter, periplasmic subunit [Candidatus Collierbacteria bacterium GW2011_GWC2_44_18]|uniref:ABC-type metal ion transporter, periplasmic subunit n=2 Tax=Microgenomates group TaxID=1794810 RepID=A0A0G1J6T9_9BACT|nr:MAG: Periplasmic solute binding protein [Microgenomates group bacterium GW2011_GWC1_44_10]KKT48683.1 MAG: ABC-type metal ion transporter, periplasmic subunit [Candidatus Collierbacteria bacterium GW2011_GWC2_44_18]KKT66985.1 MAG: ABC-type metal ion transporter, periplasmic subunit [Candidatus Woesebacteria bacterium GW2011_GWA2_44_33]
MKRDFILGLILVFVFLIMGMGIVSIYLYRLPHPDGIGVRNDGRKIRVVASLYPLYFLASEIGGDKILVRNITPSGTEPHDYEPTARDMAEIQKAKLLILNGGKLEAWGVKVKEDLKNVQVVEAGRGMFVGNDSHVWLSPQLAKKEVGNILAALILVDPKNEEYYSKNAKILNQKLDKLQEDYIQGLAGCMRKEVVTSHAAFGYLTREFGLTQVAIAGLSPDEEPSTKQMTEVARFAKEKNTKYIFFENLVSPKLAETIAEEIGAKTLILDPIEGISDNDLTQGKTYLTIMEDNLANLRTALECQ